MPKPFHKLTLEEFDRLFRSFHFTRTIDAVHMHHTWRPNHAQYNGERSIESMWLYHTTHNGWSDIAQHISIAPDGSIWTGRGWNTPPASAGGYNGNRHSGPFMFEIIGDFDPGCDVFQDPQRRAVIGVIARVQERFGLSPETLRFHRFMTDKKSCPGNAINFEEISREVREARAELAAARALPGEGEWANRGAIQQDARTDQILREWSCQPAGEGENGTAEPEEADMNPEQVRMFGGIEGMSVRAPGFRGGGDEIDLTPEMLGELRPHVINLNQGQFSDEGLFRTSATEVDAIFDDHLERALAVAEANNRPLRLLFWCHGGLIPEKAGLAIAHLQVAWWKENHVYPVHLVWESGFCDALKQILSGAREAAAARGLARDFWDYSTDPTIEVAARTLGGVKIWGAMKESARLASEKGGGAEYTAVKLADFCRKHPGKVELHAVGHSAGAIFHSFFLPKAFDHEVPPFKTLALLAPAVTVRHFKEQLLHLVGNKITHLSMFTMKRDWEEHDSVAKVYNKSLLYLIHYALEPKRKEPILGLELSARGDAEVALLFGLNGVSSAKADIVWSKTVSEAGRNASSSITHGGFDNDRATMNSVLRRILDRDDIKEFPEEAVQRGMRDIWEKPVELPPELTRLFLLPQQNMPITQSTQTMQPPMPQKSYTTGAPGAKRALCIGINKYPSAPLHGCVTDAKNWSAYFQSRGYQVTTLFDEAATHDAILQALDSLIAGSKPGDQVLFQYSGHGTQFDDISGDEEFEGSNGGKDEALCPYDFASGAFVLDDDIAEIYAKIPERVKVNCFIDCCHSGTITRFMVGSQPLSRTANLLPRFMAATPEMIASHNSFRQAHGKRGLQSKGTPESMQQVVFSACQDREVAYESNGQGEFTVRALQILRTGIEGVTNDDFMNRVIAAFGANARQHPQLDCSPAMKKAQFTL